MRPSRRSLIAAFAALAVVSALPRDVAAQLLTLGVGGAGAAPPPTFVTWDPLNKNAFLNLTNGNLTEDTTTNGAGVRATAAIPNGVKVKYEGTYGTGFEVIGVCNSSYAFSGNISGNGVGLGADGNIYGGGGGSMPAGGGTIAVEVDTTDSAHKTVYFVDRLNNRSAGIDMGSVTLYFAVSNHDASNDMTANFGQSTFVRANGGGFVAQ